MVNISIRTVEFHLSGRCLPDRLGHSGKFVENSTKLTSLAITGYRIKYGTVLWLLELQIWRGREVQMQVLFVFGATVLSGPGPPLSRGF